MLKIISQILKLNIRKRNSIFYYFWEEIHLFP